MRWCHEVVMYRKVLCVVFLGLFVGSEGARDKYAEVHVPDYGKYGHQDGFGQFEEPQITKPSEEYHYGAGGSYGYEKPKSGGYHYDDSPYYEQYNEKPKQKQTSGGYHHDTNKPYTSEPYSDGYKKSWKILRSEKIETETIDNPDADNPGNRYIVKSTHKVREKLPYLDSTIGYDHEYAYPISEVQHDLEQNEKVIDFNTAKTDPFYSGGYDIPDKSEQQEKKPKKYSYFYKYPSNDYEYDRNVQYVNAYIKDPDRVKSLKEPKQSKKYDYSNIDSDLPKSAKYRTPSFDHGPSEEDIYRNYKTDGPSYRYF